MIDDLLEAVVEIAVEIGGEVAEGAIERRRIKKKSCGNAGKAQREPWDRAGEKPPWEE